jgi:hypothetical protein
MALGTIDRGCPDRWLGCRLSGRQKEKEKEKEKEKNRGSERPPSAAPVIAAATGGQNKRNKRPRP